MNSSEMFDLCYMALDMYKGNLKKEYWYDNYATEKIVNSFDITLASVRKAVSGVAPETRKTSFEEMCKLYYELCDAFENEINPKSRIMGEDVCRILKKCANELIEEKARSNSEGKEIKE